MHTTTADSTEESVRRAEAAVAALSPSFRTWLGEEVQALVEACEAAEAEQFSVQSRQGIFLSAHTLKGQAATLGEPQIAQLAGCLCKILQHWISIPPFGELAKRQVEGIDLLFELHRRTEAPEDVNRLVSEMERRTDKLLDAALPAYE